MNTKTAVALSAVVIAAVAGGLIVENLTKPKPPPDINGVMHSIGDAPDSLLKQEATPFDKLTHRQQQRIHALKNGKELVPVYYGEKGEMTKLDAFPCSKRKAGADAETCLRKSPLDASGKTLVDFGENVMGPGEGVGVGCVPCPCTVFAGEEMP